MICYAIFRWYMPKTASLKTWTFDMIDMYMLSRLRPLHQGPTSTELTWKSMMSFLAQRVTVISVSTAVFLRCGQSVPFLELLSTVKMNKADMYIDMFQIWYKNYISKAWKNWKIQASKHRWWRDWHFHLSRYLPRCWLESGKPVCRGKFAPVHRFGMLSTESTESTSSREWTDTGSQVNNVNMVKWIINYCND